MKKDDFDRQVIEFLASELSDCVQACPADTHDWQNCPARGGEGESPSNFDEFDEFCPGDFSKCWVMFAKEKVSVFNNLLDKG